MHASHDPADAVALEAMRILEDAAMRHSRTVHLNRRLWLALYDLGLLDLVGREWVTPGEDEFAFAALDHKAIQRLVCRLQELAENRPDVVGRPGLGQIGFAFEPQLPQVGAVGSLWHLGPVA